MSALMSLTDDHQRISELLGALQTYATRLRSGANVDPADLTRFSEALHEIVDYRHHEKEEGILMPFLARSGFDWSTGLLAELRREHGHLRYLIDVVGQAAARDSLGSREERRQIAEAALAFVDFKRGHIHKEETVLLPAIVQRLSPAALELLGADLAQFDQVSQRHVANGDPAEAPIFQHVTDLVTRYSEDSAIVDVTGVDWGACDASGLELGGGAASTPASGVRARRDVPDPLTSFGRSR